MRRSERRMEWVYLFVAGIFEMCWAVAMKYSEGFTRLWPSIILAVTMALSIFLLSKAVTTLPLGTAYAIWTGIGAVGVAIMGILLFHEPVTLMRLVCIGLIVAGIIGLKFFTSA